MLIYLAQAGLPLQQRRAVKYWYNWCRWSSLWPQMITGEKIQTSADYI